MHLPFRATVMKDSSAAARPYRCPDLPSAPVDAVRAELAGALEHGNAVLSAPPGAGKSSRVPLWLLEAPWLEGRKILLLEPRRVAARALARYAARLLGEDVGQTVGYRMRQESAVSARTRLEIITEGVLTRRLLADPELSGVGCVIFDEFHERSLHADMGLALCLESRAVLRPDLRLLVMSATLDSHKVAALLEDAPVIACEGRQFPVEERYLPLPPAAAHSGPQALWPYMADVIAALMRQESGSLLAFLPGTGEIRRVAELLEGRLPADTRLYPLYGMLSPQEQDAAIAPAAAGERKVVLATAIAETSLTIEGIRLVVDAGLSRESRFDPASGLSRLETVRVSLAGARQRAGRAGRLEPGICCRLWQQAEEHGFRPQQRPEILDADLAPFCLQLAVWGARRPEDLPWLDLPPKAHLAVAREQLAGLGAIEPGTEELLPTSLGRQLVKLPLPPRLACLLLRAREHGYGALAACVASLLDDRDPLPLADASLALRLDRFCAPGDGHGTFRRLRQWAERMARLADIPTGNGSDASGASLLRTARQQLPHLGEVVALAYPERVALRSGENNGMAQYLMRNGKAAVLPLTDSLARQDMLAVAAVDAGTRGRIRLAAALEQDVLEKLFRSEITESEDLNVSPEGQVNARRRRRLGALLLDDAPLPRPDGDACALALCAFIRDQGLRVLPWDEPARQWLARVRLLHQTWGDPWPDLSDTWLLDELENWLAPHLGTCTDLRQLSAARLADALRCLLPYPLLRRLEQLAPAQWQAPSGRSHPIVYDAEGGPFVAAKLQEFFGCEDTPHIADGRVPLTLHLLSPAGRPLQITRDLGHFWRNGYPQVRAEMRGRYPRHPWPDDPLAAQATARTNRQLARGK